MSNEIKEITVDGVVYTPKAVLAPERDGMRYCIVRTYSAGVYAGYVEKRHGKHVVLRDARCLWYWDGALSTLELAELGPKEPNDCKFTVVVDRIDVTEAIAIIPCTETAMKIIREIRAWKTT
jgi:hypothetical protein